MWYCIDYGSELTRWIRFLKDSNSGLEPYQEVTKESAKKITKLQNYIIKTKNFAFAYFCAVDFDYKRYKMQNIILRSKSAKFAYLFARDIDMSDKKALEKVVIRSRNCKFMCKFACDIESANIKKIEKYIKMDKNPKYIYMLLKYNKITNVEDCKDIMMQSKKPRYLFELSKYITSKEDLEKIQDLIIESKSFTYMRLFCEHHESFDFKKIESYILASGNLEEMKKFGKVLRNSRIGNLLIFM